jgi:hypothetical protein
MAEDDEELVNVKSFMKQFFFVFTFIVSFVLMLKPEVELFGMGLYFAVNILFCFITANDVTGDFKTSGTEQSLKLVVLIIALAFTFVSIIFMLMTLSTLQRKFATNKSGIKFAQNHREDFNKTKIIFITSTVLTGVVALYTYYSADDVRKLTYTILNYVLNGKEVIWMRVLFPIAILGVGAALYGQLNQDKLLASKKPERFCYPKKDQSIKTFRDNFINSFWFLLSYVILVLSRPLIESSYMFGWLTGSTKGSSRIAPYLYGINPGIKLFGIVWTRWDIFYQAAVIALSVAGLVYASFTIRDFMAIIPNSNCLLVDTHIRQLYIAFIFFVITLFTLNTFSAFQITTVLTGIMRYFAPPTLLALTSYLVFITNQFSKLAPQVLVD